VITSVGDIDPRG